MDQFEKKSVRQNMSINTFNKRSSYGCEINSLTTKLHVCISISCACYIIYYIFGKFFIRI